MRKRSLSTGGVTDYARGPENWLDIASTAEVELTSESAEHPIENIFQPSSREWRAGFSGPQTIRLVFDRPQSIRRIRLRFSERERRRTQEFALSWAAGPNAARHEIVRQQWTFSPDGSTEEVEDYVVNLDGVAALQLDITPDISGSDAVASIAEYRIGCS